MKRIAMIANEFSPYKSVGGLGVAIERLGLQLSSEGAETSVLFPTVNLPTRYDFHPPILSQVAIPVSTEGALTEPELAEVLSRFCIASTKKLDAMRAETVIVHDNEAALATMLCRGRGLRTVFWLHSLYDHPTRGDYPQQTQRNIDSDSLIASAIGAADLVATSDGIMRDATSFNWPQTLRAVQNSLLAAHREAKTVLVESTGCMPTSSSAAGLLPKLNNIVLERRPFVLFAGRPVLSKGIGFYQAIAERLHHLDADFVAVGTPSKEVRANCPDVVWIPWLQQPELFAVMSAAAAVVHPSITEGYGLAAAESCMYATNTICHAVGGLQSLVNAGHAIGVVPLLPEKRALYELWEKLLRAQGGSYWNIWSQEIQRFHRLTEEWTQRLEPMINGGVETRAKTNCNGGRSWAQTLLERL